MKIQINIQSYSDIITNSSSELFCVIQGLPTVMKEIEEYLNSIGCEVYLNEEGYQDGFDLSREDLHSINFSIEWGEDNDLLTERYC